MRRNRRGALEWARLIDEWKASGLSLPEFCRTRGLQKTTMCGWVYKPALKRAIEQAQRGDSPQPVDSPISGKPSSVKPPPAFVPVRLRQFVTPPPIEPVPRSAIEVILGAGQRVIVEKGFDAETLRRVVAALEPGSC